MNFNLLKKFLMFNGIVTILIVILCFSTAFAKTISIKYEYDEKGLEYTDNTDVDETINSALLIDDKNSGISSWTANNVTGTYTNSSGTTSSATYSGAFAGWKLVSINGTNVTDEYIYPDNDFIYFIDEPFVSYSEITSLTFKAVWGKTIYVRDKYNIKDIANVYGYNVAGTNGDILTAKIAWDESTVYGNDTNSGATQDAPVASLEKAYELLKNSYGGKICIVNHLTIEGSESAQAYATGFANATVSETLYFGYNCNISGVVTITGKNLGGGATTAENKTGQNTDFTNSWLYIKNTRGAGVYGTKTTYAGHRIDLRFLTSTIIEGLNSVATRENYNSQGARQTGDMYIYSMYNKRLVIESDFIGYKRNTTANYKGLETGNWTLKDQGSFKALSSGFANVTHIYADNPFTLNKVTYKATASDNAYLNVRGGLSWYSLYGCSGTAKYNNVHFNIENVTTDFYCFAGISKATTTTAKNVTYRSYKQVGGVYTTYGCTGNLEFDNAIYYLGGDNKGSSGTSYLGGYVTATGDLRKVKGDIHCIIDGAVVKTLYGGGNQIAAQYEGNLTIDVLSGTVTTIYGGGKGGYVGSSSNPANITINVSGGKVTNIYGAGSGGNVEVTNSNSPGDYSSYTIDGNYMYKGSSKYYSTQNSDPTQIEYLMNNIDVKSEGVLLGSYPAFRYINIYPSTSDPKNYVSYYKSEYTYTLSDATVYGDITINLKNGANVTGNVYGGGQNGAVKGDIHITADTGAKVGNIYGGGEGLNSEIDASYTLSKKTFNLKWTNSTEDYVITVDKFNAACKEAGTIYMNAPTAANYSTTQAFLTCQETFDKYKQTDGYIYMYSDIVSKLGLIDGDVKIELNGATISGIVFGGSNGSVAKIDGNTEIDINSGSYSRIYGGGNAGTVNNSTVTVNDGQVTTDLYVGGNSADVLQNSNLTINSGTLKNVYMGCYSGKVNGDVSSQINNATISSFYGGGMLGKVVGNVSISVDNATLTSLYGGGESGDIDGNVELQFNNSTVTTAYGGGDKGDITGDVTLTIDKGTYGTIYGGGNAGTVNNSAVTIKDGTINTALYVGCNSANVLQSVNLTITLGNISKVYMGCISGKVINDATAIINGGKIETFYGGGVKEDINGNVTIEVDDAEITSLFGGGQEGNVGGDIELTFADSTITTIYGGGDKGNVSGDIKLIATTGNYETVFAGGNLGTVNGNTETEIGGTSNPYISITKLLYGGGRGKDSSFETVKGKANVHIMGLNTYVANYGSSSLGKVVGDVDVYFVNYWTGNTTNMYKTMNGIDRATNVYFDNSYVLLENRAEDGTLEGMKDIRNLYVQEGNGLKISAKGDILGDFHGGGNLYLDSGISITVNGDVYGSTRLVLNPLLVGDVKKIIGTKDNPYFIVKGKDNSVNGNTAFYSKDSRYSLLHDSNSEGYGIYYTASDVIIDETIENTTKNIVGKQYVSEAGTWPSTDIFVANNGVFTTNADTIINYVVTPGSDSYSDVTRYLYFEIKSGAVNIPFGTIVTIIDEGKIYKYVVDSTIDKIPLSEFVNIEDDTTLYPEVTDVVAVSKLISTDIITSNKSYKYSESMRMVVDFSNVERSNAIEAGPYTIKMEYRDGGTVIETMNSVAENIVKIEDAREYELTGTTENGIYEPNDNIKFTTNLSADATSVFNTEDEGKSIYAIAYLIDEYGQYVDFPTGTEIRLDGTKLEHSNSNVIFEYMAGLSSKAILATKEIEVDMTNLSGVGMLSTGKYELVIDLYMANSSGVFQLELGSGSISFNIIAENYNHFYVEALEATSNGLQIKSGSYGLVLHYSGDLVEPYVDVYVEKQNSATSYSKVSTTMITNTITDLTGAKSVAINFANDLAKGNYRIVFILKDKDGAERAREVLPFSVIS